VGIFRSILWLLVGAALAVFLWSNYDQKVVISFTEPFKTVPIPLSAALVGALAAGFLLAVALSLPNQFRLRGRVREMKRKLERVESEIAELRKLPLADVSESSSDDASDIGSASSKTGS
jgi:uncharacterized integral membrane protein